MFESTAARHLALLAAFACVTPAKGTAATAEAKVTAEANVDAQADAARPAGAYAIQLRDGKKLWVIQAPRWVLDEADVTTVEGRSLRLFRAQVDHAATVQANARRPTSRAFTNADLARYSGQRLNYAPETTKPTTVVQSRKTSTRNTSTATNKRTYGVADVPRLRRQRRDLLAKIEDVQRELDGLTSVDVNGRVRTVTKQVVEHTPMRTDDDMVVELPSKPRGRQPEIVAHFGSKPRSRQLPNGTWVTRAHVRSLLQEEERAIARRKAQEQRLNDRIAQLRADVAAIDSHLRRIRQGIVE